MNWQQVLTALAPENVLLAGMLLLLCAEIMAGRTRDGFDIAFVAVAGAAAAAWALYAAGYTAEPFSGHYSIAPQGALAKLVVLALALPVLLISRDDFAESRYYVLLLASLYGACLLVSSDSMPTLFLAREIMSSLASVSSPRMRSAIVGLPA